MKYSEWFKIREGQTIGFQPLDPNVQAAEAAAKDAVRKSIDSPADEDPIKAAQKAVANSKLPVKDLGKVMPTKQNAAKK